MLSFADASVTYNNVNFAVRGAGDTIAVNLSKPPFNINFNGEVPVSADVEVDGALLTGTAVITTDANGDCICTITFSAAISAELGTLFVNLNLWFNSGQ